jgi:TetR/AcrR family transcriptional regulator, repressor for uid operon
MRRVDPVKHEEKRREILGAAERCFLRDGFHGATTSGICAEANISAGHLYHYFDSKEAIVAGMAEIRLEQATTRFEQMMKSADPVGALILEIKGSRAQKNAADQALQLDVMAEARRNPAMAKIVQENMLKAKTLMAAVLREGQERGQVDSSLDPALTAAVLIGVVEAVRSMAIRDPKLDIKKSSELVKTMILRFLAP